MYVCVAYHDLLWSFAKLSTELACFKHTTKQVTETLAHHQQQQQQQQQQQPGRKIDTLIRSNAIVGWLAGWLAG